MSEPKGAGGRERELHAVSRPTENAPSEGNIVELPIFVLTNKEAKPKAGKTGLVRPQDYTKKLVYEVTDQDSGEPQEISLKISATTEYGFPTVFAYRVFMAVALEGQRQGWTSPKVEITQHAIAAYLGYRRPSAKDYQMIEEALSALKTINLEFRGVWWNKGKGQHEPWLAMEGLISRFRFKQEKWVEVAPAVYENYRNKYIHGVDLDYMNHLGHNPTAVRLYAYLTKKDGAPRKDGGGRRAEWKETLKSLAQTIGLKKTSPSAIRASLEPALNLLCADAPVGDSAKRVRFLKGWRYSEDRKSVVVEFYNPGAHGLVPSPQLSSARLVREKAAELRASQPQLPLDEPSRS